MLTRIVMANQGEARFYDALGFGKLLRLTGTFTDPAAHLHNRDFNSDRPGRVFNSASPPGRRRGASAHHSTGGERTPRRHATQLFARRVAAELDRARRAGHFDRLVLVAAPAFLGVLRAALPAALRVRVVATVAKDVTDHPEEHLRRYLPRSTFTDPIGFSAAKRATAANA